VPLPPAPRPPPVRGRPTALRGARARAGDARLGVGRLLRAAARECRDEGTLGGRERPAGEPGDVEVPRQGRAAPQAEDVELSALRLLRNRVARQEADAETLADGSFHSLRRAELPHACRLD